MYEDEDYNQIRGLEAGVEYLSGEGCFDALEFDNTYSSFRYAGPPNGPKYRFLLI